MLPKLVKDAQLDVPAVVWSLLVTEANECMRFDQYRAYPFCLWKVTKAFNPDAYIHEIQTFLDVDVRDLDMGYSVGLKQDAARHGTFADQVAHMSSDAVQTEIRGVLEASATSLPVERKHNVDKQDQNKHGTRITTIARASRNSILRSYGARRHSIIAASLRAEDQWRRVSKLNVRALAISKWPELCPRPRGKLWWEESVSDAKRRQITQVGIDVLKVHDVFKSILHVWEFVISKHEFRGWPIFEPFFKRAYKL